MNRKHFLRILSAALLPALLSACAAQRPELYAMRNGGSHQPFYFTDRYGELAFREFYDWAGQFVGDRAVVERDGKWGYIDRSGETVVPFRYDWAGSFGQYGFDEEVAMVKTGMDRDRKAGTGHSGKVHMHFRVDRFHHRFCMLFLYPF